MLSTEKDMGRKDIHPAYRPQSIVIASLMKQSRNTHDDGESFQLVRNSLPAIGEMRAKLVA